MLSRFLHLLLLRLLSLQLLLKLLLLLLTLLWLIMALLPMAQQCSLPGTGTQLASGMSIGFLLVINKL
jgi:hypothetical protein